MPTPDFEPTDMLRFSPEQMEILCTCENELSAIACKLNQYRYLYETTALFVPMTETAPTFFKLVQDSFAADILFSLARLFDPFKTGRGEHENCSLYGLLHHLPTQPSAKVRIFVRDALKDGTAKRDDLKHWRDKIGGHTSYTHAEKLEKAPKILISTVAGLVEETGELLNFVRRHIHAPIGGRGHWVINYRPEIDKGAKELFDFLKDGITYRRQQRNKA
jgi:hypothetical protein